MPRSTLPVMSLHSRGLRAAAYVVAFACVTVGAVTRWNPRYALVCVPVAVACGVFLISTRTARSPAEPPP